MSCFGGVFFLIFTIDLVETLRRSGENPGANGPLMAWLSFLHTPIIAEQALPFAVLLGSMIAFLNLSRRLELVVARAAGRVGLAVPRARAWWWRLLIGCVDIMAYNPLSTAMKRQSDSIEAKMFGTGGNATARAFGCARRASTGNPSSIAEAATSATTSFVHVQVFNFDPDGALSQRVDAERRNSAGRLLGTQESLGGRRPGFERQTAGALSARHDPHASRGRTGLRRARNCLVLGLRALAEQVERAGLDATAYRLRFQQLIAMPALLVAMVFVASCFSLRLFRMGGVQKMVSGGVAAGFVLYVSTKVVGDLGGVGVVSPAVAGWSPAIVGCLVRSLRASAPGGWLMDRSISHPDQGGRRRRAGARLTIAFALSAFVALIGGGFLASSGAQAQARSRRSRARPLRPRPRPRRPRRKTRTSSTSTPISSSTTTTTTS